MIRGKAMILKKMILFFLFGMIIICAQGCGTTGAAKNNPGSVGEKIKNADTWISDHMW